MSVKTPEVIQNSIDLYPETKEDHKNASLNRTTPIVLRRWFVILFALSVAGVCITTVLLWVFSRSSHGFNVGNTNHYVLSYGPTAVLIWFVAIWRQLDYQVKILAPWKELHKGKSLATGSLLADYVSTFQGIAFWRGLRNKHWSVVYTVLGFVLLKLATLSSTALLITELDVARKDVNGTVQTALASKAVDVNNYSFVSDPSLLYTTYGTLVENLEKPLGLGEGLSYPTFGVPPTIPSNSNLSVALTSFVPSFQCLPANITLQSGPGNSSDEHPTVKYELVSPECSLLAHSLPLYLLNPKSFRCPARQLSGSIQNINCSSSVFPSSTGVYKLLILADTRYSQDLGADQTSLQLGDAVQATSWGTEVAQLTASVCLLGYSMQDVRFNASAGNLESTVSIQGFEHSDATKSDYLSETDLDTLFRGALSAGDNILGNRVDNAYALEYPDPMFKTMASTIRGTYVDLLNISVMMKAASQVSVQLAAQIAHQYLRDTKSEEQLFTIQYPSHRLRINTLSAWTMTAFLSCVLVVITGLFARTRAGCEISHRETLEDNMPYLYHSGSLVTNLLASQKYKEEELHGMLANVNVYFVRRSDSSAEINLQKPIGTLPAVSVGRAQPWWHPITVQWPILTLTLLLTMSAIAILEVLQRISDANTGFLSAGENGSEMETALLRFVPAVFVLILASLFNCLDFNTLLLSPFYSMKGGSPASTLSDSSLLSSFPLLTLWAGFNGRYWAVIASSSAALVGSLMAIVVSGLYSVETVPEARSVIVRPGDDLSPTWSNSALNDSGAALISSLLENTNFQDLTGTYGEITIPKLDALNASKDGDYSILTAVVPVWRAHLRCDTLPQENVQVSISSSFVQNDATVHALYDLPPDCQFGGPNGTNSSIAFAHTFHFHLDQNATEVGKLLDLHVGPFDPSTGASQDELSPAGTKDNPLGCPSLAFIYGSVGVMTSSASSDPSSVVKVDVCYQNLQRINADLEFYSQNFTIDVAKPPTVDESSAEFMSLEQATITFSRNIANATAFQFRPQAHMDQSFKMFSTTNNNPFSNFSAESSPVDPFFQGVLYGRSPLTLSLLSLKSGDQMKQLQQGILAFYRRYMAQAMSLNMRVNRQNLTEPGPDDRTILASAPKAVAARRVVQNNTAKLVLQSMLTFMLIMGIIAVSTIRMRRLLPSSANPCTIWGQMSLLAGSSYCRGKHKEQERTLRQEKSYGKIKLGWWELPDGQERYGIDTI